MIVTAKMVEDATKFLTSSGFLKEEAEPADVKDLVKRMLTRAVGERTPSAAGQHK